VLTCYECSVRGMGARLAGSIKAKQEKVDRARRGAAHLSGDDAIHPSIHPSIQQPTNTLICEQMSTARVAARCLGRGGSRLGVVSLVWLMLHPLVH
jgi:hypothetical protein